MSDAAKKYSWLLFDLDNTILDFDANSRLAFSSVLKHWGIEEELHFFDLYKSINRHVWYMMETGKISQTEVRAKRFEHFFKLIEVENNPHESNEVYFEHLAKEPRFIPEAKHVLDEVKKDHKLCLITNGMQDVQNKRLDNALLRPYFEHIVISDEIGAAKPDSAFFDHVFELIDTNEKTEVLVIGDKLGSDIKGAVDYGLDSCWYNPEARSLGNGIIPKFQIDNLSKLIDLIL